MQRDYVRWWSPILHRDMEFLWFGNWGRPLVMFPTSAGNFYENEDFGLVGALADKVDGGEIQVVCPASIDDESWFNGWAHPSGRVRRHEQYDSYLTQEFFPYVMHRAQRSDVIVYGASFGGYHAANFSARHPESVSKVICFSGKYDIGSYLDGYWDDGAYFNNPTSYLANLPDDWISRLSRVQWIVATGEHDMLAGDNKHFAWLLISKGIPCHLEIWEGQFGHDWPWWKHHLRRFVP